MPTFHRCIFCSPGSDPAWDQPNRAVRTRMLRGVGGAPCEGCPYPDLQKNVISIGWDLYYFPSLIVSLYHFPVLKH